MPYKKRQRSRKRSKRRYKKRRKSRRKPKSARIVTQRIRGIGLPDAKLMKMRYTNTYRYNAATSSYETFRFNDLFDIDGTGEQPMLYDEMVLEYKHWRVHHCVIKYQVINYSTTETLQFYSLVGEDNTVETNWQKVAENPSGFTAFLGPALGGHNIKTFKVNCNTKKVNGGSTDSVNFRGAGSLSPSTVYYAHMGLKAPAVANTDCLVKVSMTFYVQWQTRLRQATS